MTSEFTNKKVLLVGLGVLGGGETLAKFLLKDGARLHITDMKSEHELRATLKKLKNKKVKFTLGRHDEKDFRRADMIVFNQSVSPESSWAKFAKKLKKPIETELSLWGKLTKDANAKFIAVTGTRGKTTTSTWIKHFLPEAVLGGNQPNRSPLKILNQREPLGKLYILELSSFQLGWTDIKMLAPHIAIITNLYVDHLNYHGSLKKYFAAKFKIFKNQTKQDFLILNRDNKYTKLILQKKPKSQIYYFSHQPLTRKENGIFVKNGKIYLQENGQLKFVVNLPKHFANHQVHNLLAALLVTYLYDKKFLTKNYSRRFFRKLFANKLSFLPIIPFRQEIILNKKNLLVVNDSAATSPEASIAAIKTWKPQGNLILITGGTDKNLEFSELAQIIKKNIAKGNLYLLEGSATKKLEQALARTVLAKKSIREIITSLKLKKGRKNIILFSPGAASFEKFKNEFDRGRKFTRLIHSHFLH